MEAEKLNSLNENCLFDPIYLAVLFLDLDGAQNVKKELNFPNHNNEYSIGDESEDRLQEKSGLGLKKSFMKSFQVLDLRDLIDKKLNTLTVKNFLYQVGS